MVLKHSEDFFAQEIAGAQAVREGKLTRHLCNECS